MKSNISREEKRKIMRRKYRRINAHLSKPDWLSVLDGDEHKTRSFARQGSIRHQPMNVRRSVLGKRHYYSRVEQQERNEFTEKLATAVFARVLAKVGIISQDLSDEFMQEAQEFCKEREIK